MVPEGWTKTLLGNVMEFKNGLNFTKNDTGEAIKIVGVANFKDLNELHSTEHLDVVRIANKIRDEELLANGDLLFVRSNGNKELIGRCLYFPCVYERLSFSGFTIRGRAKQELVMPEYIAAVARSSFMKQQISKNGGGTNISNLSQKILNDIVIPLPKIDEQKRIIQVLSVWDKAIATTEKMLTNSQQQKKALRQQLLTGKKRFSEFNGKWERKELGELLEYKQPTPYLVNSTDYNDDYDIPVLTAGKTFILGYTNELEGIYREKLPVIIFDDFTTDSKFVDFPFKAKSSAMKILTARDGFSIKYVFEAMQMLDFNIGGHQRHWISIFSNQVIAIPEIAEQRKIASALSCADGEIETLKQKLNHLKQEKKALMQQLLTGKRRIKVDAA